MPSKTVFDIIPDLEFDTQQLSKYYSARFDDNYGDGDED